MKKFLPVLAAFILALVSYNVFAQPNILNPNDPDVIFTSSNQPPAPTYGVMSKWGHTNRLSWNPFSNGYKSYYFKGMAFRIKFPKTYQHNVADGKNYPAILFLHGLGEPGPIWDNEYQLLHGGQYHAQKIDDGTFDGFMIYPQSQAGYLQSYFQVLKDLMDSLTKYVKLDIDRIHVGGLSSGGQAVWDFAQQQQYAKIACALEPISAAQYEDVTYFASHITLPVLLANGGQDVAPYPSTVTDIINSYKNLGGNIAQIFYPSQGHGVWNSFWSEPQYFPFINAQHKANPLVYFQHNKFCPNETVSAQLGLQVGFYAYEWQKDGVTIAGQTSNTLAVNSYGTYKGRFKRTATSQWSLWSPTPAVISQNQGTISPTIQINGLHSNVLPAPDGSSVVPLIVPNTFFTYEWRRVSDNALVSSTNTVNAAVGQYKVKVSEQFGCGSDFSDIFNVIPSNGANAPDAASSLAAIAVSNNAIQLDWNDNPAPVNNETAFEIYRSITSGGGYTLVGKTNADVLSFLDLGLSANTKYFYIVRAINLNGAAPNSVEANAITQSDITAPTAPGNLVVTSSDRSSVSLSWDASTDDVGVTKYEIYINSVKTYVTANTSFKVNNLTALQTYGFYVKALDATGNISPASNQVSGTAALRGLNYKYYQGDWNVLPDFNALTPLATGLTPNVTIAPKLQNDNFGFLWEGYIIIPVTGTYTFETNSDDGSRMYIGNYSSTATPVVDNDGLHGGQFRQGTITLNAGPQKVAFTFFEKAGGEAMNIYWGCAAAGIPARTVIPNSAFVDNVVIATNLLPVKPSNLNVTASAYNKIDLSWTDNSNNESAFEITRSTDLLGTYLNIGSTAPNVTGFIDSVGLSAQTIYWYKIKAVNAYGQSEQVSTLEAQWGFNNNYNDGSGNNRNLSGVGTPTFSAVDKKEGTHSVSLNGSTQYMNLPFATSTLFPANSYTARSIAVWLKPNVATINGTNKIVYDFGGSDNGMALRFNSGSLQAGIASSNLRSSLVVNNIATNVNWVANGWNNVCVVYNTNSLQLYLNAALIATTNLSTSSVNTSTNGSRIGASNGTNAFNSSATSTNYSGLIDDLTILKEPVNATAIRAIMNQSYTADTTFSLPAIPGAPSNLVSTLITTKTISLAFNDNSNNETLFELYRSAGNINNYRLLANITGGAGSTKNYIDSNLFSNSNYYYKVRAKGIGGTTAFTTDLLVKTADNAPVLSDVANFTMRYNSIKNIALSATDIDLETMVFSFLNPLPAFASFTNSSNGAGTLQFSPSISDLGVYTISAVVADGNGGKDTTTFSVTVNNNYTPVISAISNLTVAEGSIANTPLSATDQDGNGTLTWALTTAPSFVTLTDNGNGQGNLAFAPGYPHSGVYPITVTVSDGSGGNESASFTLTVTNSQPPVDKWYMSMKYDSPSAPAPWNNISSVNTNNLLDGNGQTTPVGIQFLNTGWNGGNAGAVTGNNSGVYPDAVIKDYYWFGAYGQPETVDFNLKGLTLGAKYNVTIFGSSAWTGLGNNGTTVYTINGVAKPLYVDKNQQNTVTFTAISPNASGNITVNMSKGTATPYGLVTAVVLEKPYDDGTAPVLPTNLTGVALSNGTVQLGWNDIAYNESSYLVYRSTNVAGPFTVLNPGASNANDVTYIDNTVLSAVTYYYKIEATNSVGSSGLTNAVMVVTSNKAPVLADIPDVYVKAGNSSTVSFTATDDVGDVMTVLVTGLPSFGVYQNTGNGKGNIVFTPSVNDIGVYSGITVNVTDNSGASITKVFNLTVSDNSVRSAYLNFGPDVATPQAAPWNNYLGYPFANNSYGNIKDDANVVTGFSFKLLTQWNGGLSNGMRTGNNTGVFPDNVMRTSFHNFNTGNHIIEFDGLNPAKRYSIGFLTNVNTGSAAIVTFTSGAQSVAVNGSYNTTVLANLNGLVPTAGGSIQVTINKSSANPILYLNGVVIREYNAADPVIRPADMFAETILEKDKIKLTWSDRSSNETGFEISRSTSLNGVYSVVTTTGANVTTYTNTGLTPNTRYFYKVRAVNGAVFSNYSNAANAITASGIVLLNQNVNVAQQAPSPWNSTSGASTQDATFSNFINTTLINTGFEMVITKEFNGAGFPGVNANGVFPANVMFTNYWTDAGQTSQVKFQNLDVSKKYRIGCFGSNTNTDYTTANYSCNGKTVELNSYYNTTKVVYLDKLTPGSNGELVVGVTTAIGSPYSFTGAFTIEYYDDNTPDAPVVNTIYTDVPPPGLRANHLLPLANSDAKAGETKVSSAPKQDDMQIIKVFPNPFTSMIQVELQNSKAATVNILVYDINGKLLFKSNGVNSMKGHNIVSANLPVGLSLSPGSYVINVWIDGKMSKSAKLIKIN
ncbi:MAG: fibronectin type III domain-containing protein [Ferruginibacter sp.]